MVDIALRRLLPSDASWIYDACQDTEIQRWTLVPRPYLIEHAKEFCSGGGPEEIQRWAIADQSDHSRGLGVISVHRIVDGVAELGYWVAPWGRGSRVCSRAVIDVVAWLEGFASNVAVTAKIASTNIASQRVVARAGFSAAGPTEELLPDGEAKAPGIIFRRELRDR